MNNKFEKFDKVMANLKKIEPSPSFDARFKKKLDAAILAKQKRWQPALATVAATLITVISASIFIYSSIPTSPAILYKSGIVITQRPGGNIPEAVTGSQPLKAGDIIMTKAGSEADIGIYNKYTIRIKGEGRVRIAKLSPKYAKGAVVFDLLEGRALISVDEGFKGSKFIINTKTAVSTALGTKFMVEALPQFQMRTDVSVLQGRVKVTSLYKPERTLSDTQTVVVGAGQKTEVYSDKVPEAPQRLVEKEWEELDELYQIGKKPRVVLLLKNRPDRAKQLLAPCPIYISDEKPREIPRLIDEAIVLTSEAVKTGDTSKHLDSIKILERIVKDYPSEKYSPQLLLYIGAYREYLLQHEQAIETFKRLISMYPDSQFASIAQCAIGIIYDEKLKDADNASQAYRTVLQKYPNALEAIWVEQRLGIKKSS